MRRQAIVLLTVIWLMLGIAPTPGGRVWAASQAATLKSVALSTSPTGTELVLRVDGIYSYKTVQVSPDTLFIDLAGAKAEGLARSQQWVNPVFSGYKLLPYRDASGQPVVRVQVDTKQANPFVVQKDDSKLRLLFGKGLFVSAAAEPASVASPEGALAQVVPPANSSGPLLVSKVNVDKHDSGETFVDVSTSRSASYRVTMLPSPARLVVDIDGAQDTSARKSYAADTAVLKAVRISQFRAKDPSVVRVVADLNGNPAFDVHATPAGVRIELRPRGMAKSAPLATQAPVPQVVPEETKTVASAAVAPPPIPAPPAAAPTAEVIDRKPAVAPPLQAETREAAKPDVQSTLPAGASSKQAEAAPLPLPASATPEALRAEQAAQMLSVGKDASPSEAQGVPPANPSSPSDEAKSIYTGEPISLNLKDVDLKDFFRLIHEISGLNIIIDPNVTGSVTLVLDSVPWDQALEIVLKDNGLGKVMEGNVLRISKIQTLTAEQDAQTKLASARMDAAPLVTVFRPINYAKAQDIAVLLKNWVGGGALSRRGIVLVDARGNTLVISDVQSQIPIILNVVSKIDKKAKQISIEARVVLATADFTRTLAASLLGGYQNNSTVTSGGTGSNSKVTIPTPTTAQPFPITTITPATSAGFGVASVTNVGAHYFINAAISAAEERDQAKTISRPTIVTQNNILGMVQQGVQIPEQTNINNTITVTYVNATLQLSVTPQVTDDNNIFLIIHVTNASIGAIISQAGPSINTQEATTSVLVPDGGTVVFGGITVTGRSKSATYIPLLGNIPVLGHLFKTNNTSDQDQELLFFVSPKILPG
ncbi:MAG TPA: type IV pilus secretin PilQ [Terriglobia bacterium]|nr:type IV pilus secretin PilQ [Terriglobia bacterium]